MPSDEELHEQILMIFDDNIDDEDYVRIRNACTRFLRPSVKQKLKNIRDLNTVLQKQGVIQVGNYTEIIKILDTLNMKDVKGKLEEVVKKMDSSPQNSDQKNVKPSPKRRRLNSGDEETFELSAKRDRPDGGSSAQTDDPDWTYSRVKKGLVCIINIMNFGNHAEYRDGSEKDLENMKKLFNDKRCYTVLDRTDCTLDQLKDQLELSKQKLKSGEFDQFICFIFSHGGERGILTSDGELILPEEIINPFKGNELKNMAGHPKVFIFQACRGSEAQPGQRVDQAGDVKLQANEFIEVDSVKHVVPVDADIVAAFSTTKGFVSFRSVFYGSNYIHKIREVFEEFSKKVHLLDLLTRVHHQVSKLEWKRQDGTIVKQMPSFESTFTKQMFLHHSQQ